MAQVTVTAQYVADTAAYVRSVRQATDATNQFAKELPTVEQSQDKVKASTIGLSAALGTLGAMAFARATSAVMKYAQQGIAAAKDYEQTVISIEGIFAGTGMSMEEAATKTQGYLADLRDFAAKTPFELPQTLDAVKRLLSIGYAADDVKDRLLPTIGDIVSALGQPASAISAVVYAFGQMKSAGRVLSQDLMQIGNALPGFNAKMALANELFQGDFGAMQKAMESGALDSSKAIDVLITAMQKFGGASGAMARQSETLAGVMSTFSDTVNNALIDGLVPSLPSLSAALNEVMPAVEDMATAFAQALGPALIDGASMMGKLAPVATEVIPPLINLVAQLTVLGDVVMALSPFITLVAQAAGFLAEAISKLPGPVFAAVGALVAYRLVLKKLQMDSAAATAGMVSHFTRLKIAVVGTMDTIRLHFMLGSTAFNAFGALAKLTSVKVIMAFKAIGVAAKGLIASMGPIGIALAAATAALEFFMGRAQATEYHVTNLKDEIDATTGALSELGAEFMASEFRENFSAQTLSELRELGYTMPEIISAIEQGGDAFQHLIDTVSGAQGEDLLGVFGQVTVRDTLQGMREYYVAAAEEAEISAQAQADAAAYAAEASRSEYLRLIEDSRVQAMERQAALNEMTEAEKNHANFVQNKSEAMARATDAATAAIKGLNSATEELTKVMSAEATYDNARQGIIDLSKELKEGDKKLKGYSQAALDNRAAIRDAAQGYIDYANSLTDPIERQNALEEGQERIRAALEKAGIDPEKSDILQTLTKQAEQSGKTVDEFAKQRQIASQYGNDVGKNFIDGIIKELERGKGQVEIGGADVGNAMVGGAEAAAGIASPSKEAIRIAKQFIQGVVVGIRQDASLAKREVNELGQSLVDALEAKMDEFASKMETASSALQSLLGSAGDVDFGLEGKFGLPSQIEEMFGEGASSSGILGGYRQLSQSVQELFAPMLDEEIVPPKVVAKNKALMDKAMADLDGYTQFAIKKVQEREAAQDRMRALDEKYRDDVAAINQRYSDLEKAAADEAKGIEARFKSLQSEINSRYDGMDKAAQANIKRIEAHYKQVIPALEAALKEANAAYDRENKVLEGLLSERDGFLGNIQKGFRSFLNNVKVDGDKASRTITRVTERMINGIKVLTSETFTEESGGGGFADALQGRLQSLRDFTDNIRTLLSRGLDPTLVQDFVTAGLDSAGETVAALAAGSDEQLAQVNSAQAELGGLISQFTTDASAAWFDYGIAQQEAIVAPLEAAASAAELALEQAQLARDTELAAAQAHAEQLRLQRQAELAAIQAERDAELERVRAYQEQLRLDREAELKAAADDYEKQKDAINKELSDIELALAANARNINKTFMDLRAPMLRRMRKFGNNIINGLINGLGDREGALYAKADAIAAGIRHRINDAFNFGSPSRVTRTMGQQIAEGLIVGMNSELRNVERAADQLAGAVMAPLAMPNMSRIGAAPVGAMGARAVGGGGSSSINITVNAGMGADGAEVGRQVVEAIRKYERRTGPVFVSA